MDLMAVKLKAVAERYIGSANGRAGGEKSDCVLVLQKKKELLRDGHLTIGPTPFELD